MLRRLFLWASRNRRLKETLPRLGFVRRAVSRFMPGESAEAALREAEELEVRGIGSVLTLLGENVSEAAEAREVLDHYVGVLEDVADRELDAEISVKLTHMGLDLDRELARANLEHLVERAKERGSFVWIDMEASPYVDATLELFRRTRAAHANVGVCLQSYLYRTADDLESLLPLRPAIRLVKGAYSEPDHLAFPKKRDVDANFLELARRLLDEERRDGAVRPAFATHDGALIGRIRGMAGERGLTPSACEFQMLYGIGRAEQRRLAAEGHPVRVLISYGEEWFPWYMRRLAERPANVWFVVRSLFRR